jgi:hypothetical protein
MFILASNILVSESTLVNLSFSILIEVAPFHIRIGDKIKSILQYPNIIIKILAYSIYTARSSFHNKNG